MVKADDTLADASGHRARPGRSRCAGAADPGSLAVAARRHPLVHAIRHALERSCEVTLDRPIIVGLSAGSDSLALLIALRAIQHQRRRESPDFRPIAVHVNHALRKEASTKDERLATEACDRFGIECIVVRRPIEPNSPGIEERARTLRYEALATAALECGGNVVAVAHHAEDQFETMIMNLCRGAGLDGLSGMAWSRPLGGGACRLIRPMLRCTKRDGRSLCAAAKVTPRYDEMNHDLSYARSRVRQIVRPMLEAIWPAAAARAAASAEVLTLANTLLEERLNAVFGPATRRQWDRDAVAELPVALVSAGIRRASIEALGGLHDDLDGAKLTAAAERICSAQTSPARFALAGGLELAVRAREIRLVENAED